MNNRTVYLMLVALVFGILSALLTHGLMTAGKVEVLVPTRDLAPRQALRDDTLFTKRLVPEEEVNRRPGAVKEHAEIKGRFAKALHLKKDQPIYFDDTAENPPDRFQAAVGGPMGAPLGNGGGPSLPSRPLLPAGAVGLSLPADDSIDDDVKAGDLFDLVLLQIEEKEGGPEPKQTPLRVRLPVLHVHRHRSANEEPGTRGKANALTFALRPQDARKVLEAMAIGKVVPVPSTSAAPPNQPQSPAPTSPKPTATKPGASLPAGTPPIAPPP